VKRLLVLTLGLSLTAVLFSLPSAGPQPSPTIVRALPIKLTATTTPKRDRTKPYTFTTTGRLIPPPRFCAPGTTPGADAANCVPVICPRGTTDPSYCLFPAPEVICSGKVTIRFKKRSTTVSTRRVSLKPDCTYRSTVTFRLRLSTRRGKLKARARFEGNVVLLPRASRTNTVRAG